METAVQIVGLGRGAVVNNGEFKIGKQMQILHQKPFQTINVGRGWRIKEIKAYDLEAP